MDGHRTAPVRQQTMYAALEWSYGLLSSIEQSILRRLSIFEGGFTLQAATVIAAEFGKADGEALNNVLGLVAKSLVMADIREAEPRLRLLKTTRAYLRLKRAECGENDIPPSPGPEHDNRMFQISNLAQA